MSDLPAVYHSVEELSELQGRRLHLALGMFDGVHLGHQRVIDRALKGARKADGLAGVLTFDPHPSRIVNPENPTRLIMPVAIKTRFLLDYGADLVVRQRFDKLFSAIEAEAFVPHLKQLIPSLDGLHVGANFRFGHQRKGDVALMQSTGEPVGVQVFSVKRLELGGEPISSTRVRGSITEGSIAEANELLGYEYFAEGQVLEGRKLGRTLGFPTLNVPWAPELQPAYGVYAVRLFVAGAERGMPGVANYGMRPTVNEDTSAGPLLEVHLLDTADQPMPGPGADVRVTWHERIREERRFDGLDALKAQIGKDLDAAKDFFARS